MKRVIGFALVTGLGLMMAGCQQPADMADPVAQPESSTSAVGDYTLVSLKVPNMT